MNDLPEVSAETIITDGWSRGFNVSQTLTVLQERGYERVLKQEILKKWEKLERDMMIYYDKQNKTIY